MSDYLIERGLNSSANCFRGFHENCIMNFCTCDCHKPAEVPTPNPAIAGGKVEDAMVGREPTVKCVCGHDLHEGERCRTAITILPMKQCPCMWSRPQSISPSPAGEDAPEVAGQRCKWCGCEINRIVLSDGSLDVGWEHTSPRTRTCSKTFKTAKPATEGAPETPGVRDESRDWPEDFEHENGNYSCRCYRCHLEFIGHKRRVECRVCAKTPLQVGGEKELPAIDIAEEDRQRAKNYARARFGSAVVSEACTFEKELRTDYHNQIREFIEEAEKRYYRERQLFAALGTIAEKEQAIQLLSKSWDVVKSTREEERERAERAEITIRAVEESGGWIEIDTQPPHPLRLPVGEDHLLLVQGPELSQMQCVGYWNRLMKSWVVNGERMDGLDVTHYQPLPAPPPRKES